MEILFNPDGPYFSDWIRVHDVGAELTNNSPFRHFTHVNKSPAALLCSAAHCGFRDLAKHLIDHLLATSELLNANDGI